MLLSQVPAYFKTRRDRLMKAHSGAAFLFPSNRVFKRNPDVEYAFRQESNFFYLTGFEEPESFLALLPSGSQGSSSYKTVLFVQRRNVEREMWEGERYGVDRAISVFGADEAYPIDELEKKLPELLRGTDQVFYRLGECDHEDRLVLGALETYRKSLGRSGKALTTVSDPTGPIGEMRLYKTAEEIEIMRKACRITAESHKQAMKEVRPGMNEFQVEALIDYGMRRQGCQRMGYGSIVAGGRNATCLHYRSNNEPLKDGDLILIDAGGELDYYTSDITRTFPVGKRFSEAQAKAYDLVLNAQLEAIKMAKPGATLPGIHRRTCEVLTEGLLSLGLLKGNASEILKSMEYKRFYPHNTSHWLGMDVHDVGAYQMNGEPRKLEAGMVFTIEPGFYAQPDDQDVPAAFRNIGIRIEDDILVTAQGCENLTKDVPKSRDEIEALRS